LPTRSAFPSTNTTHAPRAYPHPLRAVERINRTVRSRACGPLTRAQLTADIGNNQSEELLFQDWNADLAEVVCKQEDKQRASNKLRRPGRAFLLVTRLPYETHAPKPELVIATRIPGGGVCCAAVPNKSNACRCWLLYCWAHARRAAPVCCRRRAGAPKQHNHRIAFDNGVERQHAPLLRTANSRQPRGRIMVGVL
jgi:hypothetical protein